jgi:hypothetical protein
LRATVTLDEAVLVSPHSGPGISALDESLERLAARDARKSQVVELLFLGGFTYDEVEAVLGAALASDPRPAFRAAPAARLRRLEQSVDFSRALHRRNLGAALTSHI